MTALTDSAGVLGIAAYATDTYTPPGLILGGNFPLEVEAGTYLNPGADIAAYTLIGRITATGKLTLCVQTANDGSQVPVGVTTKKLTNSGADQTMTFWKSGEFNYDYVTKDASWSLALLKIACDRTTLGFGQAKTASPTAYA